MRRPRLQLAPATRVIAVADVALAAALSLAPALAQHAAPSPSVLSGRSPLSHVYAPSKVEECRSRGGRARRFVRGTLPYASTCPAPSLSTAHERRSRRFLLAYVNLSTPSAPRSYLARTLRCAVHFPTCPGPRVRFLSLRRRRNAFTTRRPRQPRTHRLAQANGVVSTPYARRDPTPRPVVLAIHNDHSRSFGLP